MKKTMSSLVVLVFSLFSAVASAFEVDFVVRINNVDQLGGTVPRLVTVANFDNADLASRGGSFGISYEITDLSSNTLVFSGTASIDSTQTQVTVGDVNTGRITMQYDSVADRVETRFAIRLPGYAGQNFGINASDVGANWVGRAQISSVIPF